MAEDAGAAAAGGGSPMKIIIIMIIGGVLLVAVSIGGVFFMMKSMGMLDGGGGNADAQKDISSEPAIYFPLEPAFVVNFQDRGRTRFLQISMEISTRDSSMIDELTKHMPLIRNNILLILSNQKAESLHTVEGKEQIRTEALEELRRILSEQTGLIDVGIDGLYFTSFVTQ